MPTQFLMLPPQNDKTREWGARLAAELPELEVIVAEDFCQHEHHGQADKQKTDAARVGYSGAMHNGGPQKAQSIGGDMLLASLHQLAAVKAALPPFAPS